MRLVICCNHSFPHIGGSEKVVQQIAESMAAAPYNHEVIVLSRSLSSKIEHNKVLYKPCPQTPESFLSTVVNLKPDHLHTYSDCFRFWTTILHKGQSIACNKSIALVGMNEMIKKNGDIEALIGQSGSIFCIAHSDNYQDYGICNANGIPVTVIPNGVDLSEFDNNDKKFDFGYPDKKVILCVSNYFPGKGQEHLIKVLDNLYQKRQDWQVVFMSTTVNFPFAEVLANYVQRELRKRPYLSKFLVDVPRSDTISAFKSADVFAFPSQKEVAPLVAIESQAAKLPWVALPVGNIPQLKGGIVAVPGCKNSMGYLTYSRESYADFAESINKLFDEGLANELSEKGRHQVESVYNWKVIAEQYNKVFSR